MTDSLDNVPGPIPAAVFRTTHWSVVLNAAEPASPRAAEAMSHLCNAYWFPLYAYVRRQGYKPEEAQDLTQEFFARMLAKNCFRALDRQKGKFRSYLLAAMEHFLAKEWRDAHRLKRGGRREILSLNDGEAERRYNVQNIENMTAEKIYERRWVLALLEQAIAALRAEFNASGRGPLFESLLPHLTGEDANSSYAAVGAQHGMTEGAIKVCMHRMRARYGELVRAEIAHTVSSPEEVEEELRHLRAVLAG